MSKYVQRGLGGLVVVKGSIGAEVVFSYSDFLLVCARLCEGRCAREKATHHTR